MTRQSGEGRSLNGWFLLVRATRDVAAALAAFTLFSASG
jgi:hypothetical protein